MKRVAVRLKWSQDEIIDQPGTADEQGAAEAFQEGATARLVGG